jgi:hypothetical protein
MWDIDMDIIGRFATGLSPESSEEERQMDYHFILCLQHWLADTDGDADFNTINASSQSYEQIVWYFEMAAIDEAAFRDNGFQFRVGTQSVTTRACEFLIAVRTGKVARDTFKDYVRIGDHSDDIVDAIWVHVSRVMEELDQLRICVANTIESIFLTIPPTTSTFISPSGVQETWMSDQLIEPDIKSQFMRGMERLGNDGILAHPSDPLHPLHPLVCVFGETRCVTQVAYDADDIVAHLHRIAFADDAYIENSCRGESKYQWIPCDIKIEDDGQARILSYINSLDPTKHLDMYNALEGIFKAFVPMFERILACLELPIGPLPVLHGVLDRRCPFRTPDHLPIPAQLNVEELSPFSLSGKVVQVLVRLHEFRLTPENPLFVDTWHVDGSDAEQIVACGIYHYECENICDTTIDMQVVVHAPPCARGDAIGLLSRFGLRFGRELAQPLASLATMEGRCVAFPNTYQHKFGRFELVDKTKPGVCKFLSFSLVDPTKRIPSTFVIPPQQQSWLNELSDLTIKSFLPFLPDTTISLVKEYLYRGLSPEDAKANHANISTERIREETTIISATFMRS